jgi:hypothetical protein
MFVNEHKFLHLCIKFNYMKKNLLKSIIALVAINMYSLANAQWSGVAPAPLSTTMQNVQIGASAIGTAQPAMLHVFKDLNPFNNVRINREPLTTYLNCNNVLFNLSKNKYSNRSGGLFVSPTLSSIPTWGMDIDNTNDNLTFSFSNWIGFPKTYQRLSPITGNVESVSECPIPTQVFAMNTTQVTSFVPFKANNISSLSGALDISSISGSINLNSNVEVKGEFRVVNTNGGPNPTEFKIDNAGFVRAREIKVDVDVIPDYVFKEGYKLMSLDDLEKFIQKEKHLPNIKGENEYEKNEGLSLGEMNLKLLEKVEELTLYTIQQQKQIDELKKLVQGLVKK